MIPVYYLKHEICINRRVLQAYTCSLGGKELII